MIENNNINYAHMKRVVLFLTLGLLIVYGQGSDGLSTKINEWKTDVKTILNTAVAIFAIAGGFLVFLQYMQGSEQAQRNFIRFLSGLAIFGLVDLIVNFFIEAN